jgi:hypothetical protein
MPLPFLPLALSAGFGLADYLANRGERKRLEDLEFPDFNVGDKRRAALSRIGERTTRTGRSASKALSARGLGGSSAALNLGGQIAGQGGRQAEQAFASIEDIQNRARQAEAIFNFQRAQAINQAPGISEALGTGVSAFGSLYPLMNPEQFTPNFGGGQGQGQQPPQTAGSGIGIQPQFNTKTYQPGGRFQPQKQFNAGFYKTPEPRQSPFMRFASPGIMNPSQRQIPIGGNPLRFDESIPSYRWGSGIYSGGT